MRTSWLLRSDFLSGGSGSGSGSVPTEQSRGHVCSIALITRSFHQTNDRFEKQQKLKKFRLEV